MTFSKITQRLMTPSNQHDAILHNDTQIGNNSKCVGATTSVK